MAIQDNHGGESRTFIFAYRPRATDTSARRITRSPSELVRFPLPRPRQLLHGPVIGATRHVIGLRLPPPRAHLPDARGERFVLVHALDFGAEEVAARHDAKDAAILHDG